MPSRTHTWDLFIAHAGPDGTIAKELYDLVRAKARTFLDSVCVKLGDDWDAALAVAQTQSLITVVLVSANTARAYYQREEIAAAIAMARNDGETHRVVPLYVGADGETAAIPYGLRLKHALTLSDDFSLADAAKGLLDLLTQLGSNGEATAAVAWSMLDGDRRGILHAPADDWQSPVQRNPWRYKVVAFDFDGTLLRGADFVFSWERVWGALKVSKQVQKDLRRDYRLKAQAATSPGQRIDAYRKWCEAAVDHFRNRGLTRTQLAEIATPLQLTANCRETLRKLREAGMVTAIISGGIDTFLEERLPDFRDHVDFVFMNKFLFDADGTIESVLATAYDFEGKADALRLVCHRAKCSEEETVFVGDHFNDEAIMNYAKLAIAYPPMDKVALDAAGVSIAQDDLSLILQHVLVE